MTSAQKPAPQHLGAFRYRYAGGPVYDVRCDSDTQLHWRCVEGDEAGREGDEQPKRVQVRPGVHFLTWVESDGLVVAQVLDYDSATVNCVLVAGGERIVLQGTLERLS